MILNKSSHKQIIKSKLNSNPHTKREYTKSIFKYFFSFNSQKFKFVFSVHQQQKYNTTLNLNNKYDIE